MEGRVRTSAITGSWYLAGQLFHMRPAPGYADYRTPIRGLYQAGSATHGGGGVCGIPGDQTGRQLLEDRLISRAPVSESR